MTMELAFNGIFSILMVLFGFLLNRVFNTLDKLQTVDTEICKTISSLEKAMMQFYIDKKDFQRHEEREETIYSELRDDISKRINSMEAKLDRLGEEISAMRILIVNTAK